MEVLRSILSCFSSRSRTRARPGAQSHHGLWSSGASDKNKSMVEQLQRYGVIRSTKVAEVMEAIDRGLFVPLGGTPYHDSPMPIGYNATISAPHMHAACLELLEKNLQPGMRALDVGSGTGYLTACFALMVGPEGRAVGVEHIPELVATSIENIKKSAAAPQLNDGSLSIHVAVQRASALCGVWGRVLVASLTLACAMRGDRDSNPGPSGHRRWQGRLARTGTL
ncbi:protein-L-isoaspartate O-methyltransferase-like isoform X4 [Miscanthus floridulus]|uniref:protein-L-isoaspartate O-methyltransferase-like isoform X4 n=1 Tax=Miscanthus floridulus TaxID=154761 RepID=UPI00345818BC